MTNIKTRSFPEHNYKAIWHDGKTFRVALDSNKPITEILYPEFYDVGITSKCMANCRICYVSATNKGHHFDNVVEKVNKFFGTMTENQRPFQVALGGTGEPTMHPDFSNILKSFYDLGIVPNYTTNGMHINNVLIDNTKKYCGGVALSCHPHLKPYWTNGAELLIRNGIRTNFHHIISDRESIDEFMRIYKEYKGRIEYFVLLLYMPVGRAIEKVIDWNYFEAQIDSIDNIDDIAFSSNFYNFLKGGPGKIYGVSLYPPEILSKYLIMDDEMKIYNNSFETKEVDLGWNKWVGLEC